MIDILHQLPLLDLAPYTVELPSDRVALPNEFEYLEHPEGLLNLVDSIPRSDQITPTKLVRQQIVRTARNTAVDIAINRFIVMSFSFFIDREYDTVPMGIAMVNAAQTPEEAVSQSQEFQERFPYFLHSPARPIHLRADYYPYTVEGFRFCKKEGF